MKKLTIGQVARSAEVTVETVRYYEREGLIDNPPRSESGYRQYPERTVAQLRFISNCKGLGFSLHEVRELLRLLSEPDSTCDGVIAFIGKKIDQLSEKIDDMTEARNALEDLIQGCEVGQPLETSNIIPALGWTPSN